MDLRKAFNNNLFYKLNCHQEINTIVNILLQATKKDCKLTILVNLFLSMLPPAQFPNILYIIHPIISSVTISNLDRIGLTSQAFSRCVASLFLTLSPTDLMVNNVSLCGFHVIRISWSIGPRNTLPYIPFPFVSQK